LPISYAAMGLSNGPYKVAHSHPQALGQTRLFLRERGIVPLAYADTAGAAALVREQGDPAACAIAPAMAAELYGLHIAEDHVEDAKNNTTRFVVLAREPLDPATLAGAAAMTTFVFEVRNVPAALYWALSGFAANGVNMTKLESYQQGASFSATMFYADILGAPGDPAIDHALEGLKLHSKKVLMLGSYAQARPRG
ncbi:MAG TPA: prephenate dehydratase domain-containing protein, partial [Croceibacterium sp.]